MTPNHWMIVAAVLALISIITLLVLWLLARSQVKAHQQAQQQTQLQLSSRLSEREADHQQALEQLHTQQHTQLTMLQTQHQQQVAQLSSSLDTLQTQHQQLQTDYQDKLTTLAGMTTELSLKNEQFQQWQQQLQQEWSAKFTQLSQETLTAVQASMTTQAEATYQDKQALIQKDMQQLLAPIQQLIKAQEEKVLKLNDLTLRETTSLKEQLMLMADQTRQLAMAKERIVSVLTDNKGRGNWGELQLQRLLEASGLQAGSSYVLQPTLANGSRPDVQINLPNGHVIFIDVKSLIGTLERLAQDEDTPETQAQQVKSLKEEIKTLGKRAYASHDQHSVDFVVLYVPRESMLRRPLELDPDLLETAFTHNVILASPLILMAMLKTVAQGWSQAFVTHNARDIIKEAKDLHKRFATFAEHFVDLRKKVDAAQKKLDETESSLTRMVLPQARRLEQLGAKSAKNLPEHWTTNPNTSPTDNDALTPLPLLLDTLPTPNPALADTQLFTDFTNNEHALEQELEQELNQDLKQVEAL
jgi:DNA recombination protein RmuC